MVTAVLCFMKDVRDSSSMGGEEMVCAIWTNWLAGQAGPPWESFSWHRNKLLFSKPPDFVSTLQRVQLK